MQVAAIPAKAPRVRSVDMLRGVTIFLMIYFNTGVVGSPWWLEHFPKQGNGMTIVDVIFPAFLLIMGISIPYSLGAQREKGVSVITMLPGILLRSVSLMVMGLMDVGVNHPRADLLGLTPIHWSLGIYIAYLGIWHTGAGTTKFQRGVSMGLRLAGGLFLGWYAWIFTSADGGWFTFGWWGILGILGWSYLIASLLYLAIGNHRDLVLFGAFVLVLYWVFQSHLSQESPLALAGTGSLWGGRPCLVLLGVAVGILLRDSVTSDDKLRWMAWLAMGGALVAIFWEPAYGIGKVRSTPTWIFASLVVTMIGLMVTYYILDVRGVSGPISAWLVDCGKVPLLVYIVHPAVIDVMKLSGLNDGFSSLGRVSYALGVVMTLGLTIVICGACVVLFRRWGVNIRA